MTFKELPVGAAFVDESFGSHWTKTSSHAAQKAVEDDSGYVIGDVAEFLPGDGVLHNRAFY